MNEHTLLAQWKSSQVLGKKKSCVTPGCKTELKKEQRGTQLCFANIVAPALIYSTNHPPAASAIHPTQRISHVRWLNSRWKEFRYFHSLFSLAIFFILYPSMFIIFFWPSPLLHLNKVHSSFTGTTEENHHSWPLFSALTLSTFFQMVFANLEMFLILLYTTTRT